MSCKIDRIVESAGVVLRVSGQLHGEHVETLRELIKVERSTLALDLVEVTLCGPRSCQPSGCTARSTEPNSETRRRT